MTSSREASVDPGRVTYGALGGEAGADGGADHGVIVGEGVDLQPVQAADGEAVAAQHRNDVGAQVLPAERRRHGDPYVRAAVVQVDGPQQRLARQFPGGQLDDGERDHLAVITAGGRSPVGRVG